MKVETIVSEKNFEPVTFNVTVESLGELCLLWGRLNLYSEKVKEQNSGYHEIANNMGSDTYSFFQAVDAQIKKAGLR